MASTFPQGVTPPFSYEPIVPPDNTASSEILVLLRASPSTVLSFGKFRVVSFPQFSNALFLSVVTFSAYTETIFVLPLKALVAISVMLAGSITDDELPLYAVRIMFVSSFSSTLVTNSSRIVTLPES